ncbi:hypothetical protein VB618_19455, partial [Microvirga sp. CF3062]|uniref:hypothetical protein n=1 Tax=Microvirga sp. CF3062 TaxID=3110182 RepID=UPI002E75C1A3
RCILQQLLPIARKDTAAYASLPLSTMSKSMHLSMQSIKETSAEQTLFPTEVGPSSPVSEEALGAVRISGGVDGRYIG